MTLCRHVLGPADAVVEGTSPVFAACSTWSQNLKCLVQDKALVKTTLQATATFALSSDWSEHARKFF